ncbi:hypothetical protein CFB84_38340 [Burkholderia aenigmatica]|uniref:Uncharacterized protein n=1 Tax=Burkholderia aenigmatica TaxID=2015348 RepID=A0A228HUK9_9BURK|nr:hypothetical protein CFB84_38340 [Burkholderia aenigmatica]
MPQRLQPRHPLLDDERTERTDATLVWRPLQQDDCARRFPEARTIDLLAIQHPFIGGLVVSGVPDHRSRIGSRARLRNGNRQQLVAEALDLVRRTRILNDLRPEESIRVAPHPHIGILQLQQRLRHDRPARFGRIGCEQRVGIRAPRSLGKFHRLELFVMLIVIACVSAGDFRIFARNAYQVLVLGGESKVNHV